MSITQITGAKHQKKEVINLNKKSEYVQNFFCIRSTFSKTKCLSRGDVHLVESQISKGSKKRQGPALGVRFSEMFVFKTEVSVERESSICRDNTTEPADTHEGEQRYKPYIVGDPRMVSLL